MTDSWKQHTSSLSIYKIYCEDIMGTNKRRSVKLSTLWVEEVGDREVAV